MIRSLLHRKRKSDLMLIRTVVDGIQIFNSYVPQGYSMGGLKSFRDLVRDLQRLVDCQPPFPTGLWIYLWKTGVLTHKGPVNIQWRPRTH